MRVPSPSVRLRRVVACGLVAGLLTLATACGGDDDGAAGSAEGATDATRTSEASAEPTPSETVDPGSDCADGAFCDSFDDASSGWAVEDTPGYATGYDDGGYRVRTRENASHAVTAPAEVPEIAGDYGITVDVDARPAEGMPDTGAYGITCWNHPTEDDAGDSAFLLYVDAKTAIIGLWDEISAEYVPIAEEPLSGRLEAGESHHLTASCARTGSEEKPQASLALSVDGTEVVTKTYTGAVDHPWSFGDGVGLVTAGEGAEVSYDDFRVSAD